MKLAGPTRLNAALAPAAAFDGIHLRPGRTGQVSALAAAVAPAQHFQSAIVPDRQQSLGVGEHELHVAFAAAVAATP